MGLQAHRAELPPPAVASSGWQIGRAELAFSPSSEKWPGNTILDVKSRLESIARIGLLKKNDLEVACGR